VPGAILEKGRIGNPGIALAWTDAKSLRKIAEKVRTDQKLSIDWLENLSVAQVDEALMVTYFLRSTTTPADFALRVTVVPAGPAAWVDLPSVRVLWSMAEFLENDAAELFGIRFLGPDGVAIETRANLIPEALRKEIEGFPLRKAFDVTSVDRAQIDMPDAEVTS
jgi:NADH:ubiquinone oxidoreductase subunit C